MTDDELAAELAAVLADRRAPREVTEAAKGLFTWRTIDAELAALSYDSLVDAEEGVVRGAAGPRALVFEAGDVEIEVEVAPGRDGRRLVGQLSAAGAVDLAVDGAARTLAVDELGRFATDLPAETVSVAFTVVLPTGRVRTAPMVL
jgi:hypothetical protein